MANILWNSNPLPRLFRRVDRLENSLKKLGRNSSNDRQFVQDGLFPFVLGDAMRFIRVMAELVECLRRHRQRTGRFDPDVADDLNQTLYSLTSEIVALGRQGMAQGRILGKTPIYREIRARLHEMGSDVSKVVNEVDRQTEATMERDPRYKLTRRFRVAVKGLDEKLAKKVSLKHVDEWLSGFFPVNWEDPITLQRVAKVFWLAHIPFQTWELRYRSDSPGRPFIQVAELSDFPDMEFLQSYEADYELKWTPLVGQ